MQRDAGAPAVRRRPDDQDAEDGDRHQAQHEVRSDHAEVDEDDDRRDRKPIADDRERPRVAGIALVDEAARRTRERCVQPENSAPTPQCGQRLRSPRASAVLNGCSTCPPRAPRHRAGGPIVQR